MSKQKRTSRREFLKGVGIAATGVATSAALAGCTESSNNCAGDASATTIVPQTPDGQCICPTVCENGTQTPQPNAGASVIPGTDGSVGGGGGAGTGIGTGGSAGAGGAAGAIAPTQTECDSSCPEQTQCPTPATLPSDWAKEADVVVLGTGFAGLSAAINAHEAGASVLILEKMPKAQEGGNSVISGNMWWTPTTEQGGVTYIKALCFGLTDDTCIQALAKEMVELNNWLSSTIRITALPLGIFQPEYPELPGSEAVRTWTSLGGIWKPFRDAVASRNIEVMYDSPVADLIQDPGTREVKGVFAQSGGQKIAIKAKKGVVLACGGFEFNHEIQAQFLPGWPVYSQGTPGNTGDGIKMAVKAGADLWHMNNALAHVGCMSVPDIDVPIPVSLQGGYILVDKLGKRFMNESRPERHGFGHKEFLFFFDGLNQDFTRIPCYAIMDNATLRSRALPGGLMGWYGEHANYRWSSDNSAEVTKGWIKQGQTLTDLASTFGANGATLSATVEEYNGFCAARNDSAFGRPAVSLVALGDGPYFAAPIYPLMYNTQGGPRRNEKCQVVDPFRQPIPRLYSAGELGSFWGWMYNGGGNNCECMCTGRIAARNAVAEKPWA